MAADEALAALELSMAELSDALFADPATRDATLARIVAVASQNITDCDAAGILAAEPGGMATASASAPIVVALHALQIDAQEGPCFDAVARQVPSYATDLVTDEQWPTFSKGAAALGIRSVLAYPVATGQQRSALNLYAAMPAAFGAADRARGLLLSVLAGVAIDAADEHERADAREANIRAALKTREMIGQAQGILMERERITADQAFALLRDSSQHLNVKLREVARTLIETGETPITARDAPTAGA
jgi:hypothetical protein